MPRFLIVSETEDFRVLLAQLLAIEWPDVVVDDCDPHAEAHPPAPSALTAVDVVLLDLGLETPDGVAWLRRAREVSGLPPVIALVGDEGGAREAMELGAAACLPRSGLTKARLASSVEETLHARQAQPAADAEQTLLLPAREGAHGAEAAHGYAADDEPPTDGGGEGIKIAGYRIIRELAQGGMSIIFLASDLRVGRTVVLKVLDENLLEDEQFITAFIREYRLIGSITSRYVVRIYDQGFTDMNAYIAMEYFSQGTLKDRLRSRAFARHEAIAVFYEILMSLRDVHEHGIVHYDLKPQNIVFRNDGSLALIDFGISRQAEPECGHGGGCGEILLGTPYYMSPEQAAGQRGDHRSDLYSAGAILYEILTGAKLYTASSAADLLSMHLTAPIPRLPARLAAFQGLLDRLLAKGAEDRYQGAAEVLEAIDRSFLPHAA